MVINVETKGDISEIFTRYSVKPGAFNFPLNEELRHSMITIGPAITGDKTKELILSV